MNPLDSLLTTACPVRDISPDGLHDGRAALDAAITTGLHGSAAVKARKPGRWLRTGRARVLTGTAVATAGAAAAATVIAMPSSPAGPHGGPAAGVPTAPVVAAATVLNEAAQAAGSQPGWPNAQYWYSEDTYTCGGQLYTARVWLSRHGNGVVEKTGPKDSQDPRCRGDLFTAPIIDTGRFGPYTWSQLDTLPTDPAQLKPKLMADFPSPDQPSLFEDIEILLVQTPAPPAVREALLKVDASIPGVTVTGRYTDALGRTGTVLRLGSSAMVIDPASGAVLDETDSGSTVIYVTQGPATGEPHLGGPAGESVLRR
jgi:hypothetical protein